MSVSCSRKTTLAISEGFAGQKYLVIPDPVIRRYTQQPPYQHLFVTDIGYYPKAEFHFMERPQGSPQHILIYCVDGEGWFAAGGKSKKVRTGQWFIIPKNTPHRYGAHPRRPWTIYWIHFTGTASDFFVKYMKFDKNPRSLEVHEESLRIRMWEEMYAAVESGYSRENIGIMVASLWRFLGSFIHAERYGSLFNQSGMQPLDSVIEFMKKNVFRRLQLAEIARQTSYSVSHFSALFRKYTGYAPLDYFLHLKIQKACQLLDLTEFRIKEISLKLGYDDPYFFSRLFSRIMGQSPAQYRSKRRR